jgi:long-chain acyl-CoA synthetase
VTGMERAWLGRVPSMHYERHYGDRIVRCFVERPRNAYELLREAAARNPGGEALVCGPERLTYAGLEAAVERCAAALQAVGVGKGDRVAMLLGNGIPFPVMLFAALRIGAIAVPMSVREQAPGIAYMLAHSGAKLLAYDAGLADRLPAPEETPQLAHRVEVAPGGLSALPLLAEPGGEPPAAVDEEDTAIILYTSGTTGRPKGAMLTHLGICHSAMHFESCMGLTSGDRAVVAVPMSHVTGVIALIAAMVRAAAALIVMPAFRAAEFLDLAAGERMTHSLMVPAMYNLCLLDHPAFEPTRFTSWRVGGYGGAPMAPATIARFAEKLPGLSLMNAYGSTETTSPVTLMPPSETAARSDSVGCAVPCADILVMDEAGRELPDGEAGELWLGGPMVVPGYWQDPAATAANFAAGYWRSGDIGSKDVEGYVRVFDRKKDMINRGGHKIYSVEVENALMSFPGVIEAAVVAEPCSVLGERVHAFVVAGAGVERADLKRHCAALLADYKVPESFTLSAEPLPRNANGKLLKRNLRPGAAVSG